MKNSGDNGTGRDALFPIPKLRDAGRRDGGSSRRRDVPIDNKLTFLSDFGEYIDEKGYNCTQKLT
jgi:hypothetical protein